MLKTYNGLYSKYKSYGILLFRINEDQLEFLLVKRKNTYSFWKLINSEVTSKNIDNIIMDCIKNIDSTERELILNSKNFEQLISKSEKPCRNSSMSDIYFQQLKKLIKQTKSEPLKLPKWEIPKGQITEEELYRLDRQPIEQIIKNCAVREFGEETGIKPELYQIIDNKPFNYSFTGSDGKTYTYNIYIGFTENQFPKEMVNTCFELSNEMYWFNVNDIFDKNIQNAYITEFIVSIITNKYFERILKK